MRFPQGFFSGNTGHPFRHRIHHRDLARPVGRDDAVADAVQGQAKPFGALLRLVFGLFQLGRVKCRPDQKTGAVRLHKRPGDHAHGMNFSGCIRYRNDIFNAMLQVQHVSFVVVSYDGRGFLRIDIEIGFAADFLVAQTGEVLHSLVREDETVIIGGVLGKNMDRQRVDDQIPHPGRTFQFFRIFLRLFACFLQFCIIM